MKQRRFSLFLKAALFMTTLAVIPLAVVGIESVKTLWLHQQSLRFQVLRYETQLAQVLAEKLNARFASLEEQQRHLAKLILSDRVPPAEKKAILQELVTASPDICVLAVVNEEGDETLKVFNAAREPALAAFPATSSHGSEPLFFKFLNSFEPVWEITRDADDPRLKLYYPLPGPGPRQALYINDSLQSFWKEIINKRIGRNGYCFLVDRVGDILAHPVREKMLEKTSARDMPIVAWALAANVSASEFENGGRTWIGASWPVRWLGGAVICLQPKHEAMEPVLKIRQTAMLTLAFSVLAAILLAFLFAQQIIRPLRSLIRAAGEVNLESGRFPEPVAVKNRDELADLTDAFNSMTKQLRTYAAMQMDRLVAEKTKTEAIVFSINDGLIMTDHQGFIEFINNRARQILDIAGEYQSLLRKPLWDFIPNPEILDALWDIAHHPDQNAKKEVDLSATGYRRVFQVSCESVRTAGKGEDIGVVMIFHDITLEKELEQMKDDFMHSITHDLRNPMSSIRGFLKFLIDGMAGAVNDQQKKILETMDRASTRLLGMINDILDVAKLESGKMTLNLAPTDLKEVGRHVAELLQSQAAKKNISLVLDADPALPAVQADPALLERLFTNLMGNALKFTPEGGKITLELRDELGRISGAVVDTGEGIPADYMDKIFDKFQQVAGQRKGGTGLGLTICKYIVESHKGEIGVQSELGKGSRFHFWISKDLGKIPSAEKANPAQTSPAA